MQRLIREWHKDEFLDLRRGSLYHAIERLRQTGCIVPIETRREGRRPERTVYRLTEVGEQQLLQWLEEMLTKPMREPTQFFAALSFLPHLPPENVVSQLQERIGLIDSEIADLSMVLKTMTPKIGRLVLVEIEYVRAMRQAERAWVRSLLEDIRTGRLTWKPPDLCREAAERSRKSQKIAK
jgi:DNA-binding PadR family transcriptional regulator